MGRVDRVLIYIICSTSLIIVIGLAVSVSPRDAATNDQVKVEGLLLRASPEFATTGAHRIERVILGNGIRLAPERDQFAAGYVITAHVVSSGFIVKARPLRPGITGLYAYFRDTSGNIRFERSGQRASAGSRILFERALSR